MSTEAKWTPGPWRACIWDPMERPHVHADAKDERVCSARRDLPMTAADAHLIAAAPDLYDALEVLLGNAEDARTLVGLQANGETGDGPWTQRYDEMTDAVRAAHAALAKARGGSR